MAVIRRRYTGISAGSWEMLEKNVSSEKTTDFSFDLKHSQRRFLVRRRRNFLEIFSVYEKIAVYENFNI